MADASKSLGYHPFQAPSSNASEVYTNFEGQTLGACEYCGHCERFGCEANAKASPNVCILPALLADSKFELRTHAQVKELVYDKAARKVTAVRYVDTRSGEEYEQPAGIVLLTSYVFGNVQHMLLAGIGEPYDHATGKGVVGKNYAYQFEAGANAFFEDKELNPYWGSAGMGTVIDDFNGESFDHGGLGFFGGGYIMGNTAGAPPIAGRTVPHGTPEWGSEWKRATVKWYYHAARFNTQGSVYANRDNYMDLDPTYKDALGRPLIRLTYNPPDNEFKMSAYLLQKLEGVIKAMNPTHYDMHPRPKTFTVVPYQSTHNTGGTMMGADPKGSVVNRYLQAWDAHNLFVQGASVFPQQHGYNPTGTVGALALIGIAGHQENNELGIVARCRKRERDAIHDRHADVGEEKIEASALTLQHVERFATVTGSLDVVTNHGQPARAHRAQCLFVFGDQNFGHQRDPA